MSLPNISLCLPKSPLYPPYISPHLGLVLGGEHEGLIVLGLGIGVGVGVGVGVGIGVGLVTCARVAAPPSTVRRAEGW